MKKFFTISALAILAITTSGILQAQNCDFAQTGVRYNYSNSDGNGNCIINIDLYFDLRTNSGSKYVTLHIWPTGSYPGLSYDNPPVAADLTGSSTIVIHHFQDHSLSHVDTVYKPDPQVQPQYQDMHLTIGPSDINSNYDRFTITNINLTVPGGCDVAQSFTLDAWSTESESMNAIHCFEKGILFFANNPRAVGLLNCNLPRTFNVQIFSIDPAQMTVGYTVYVDDGDNVFNKVEDTLVIKSESGIVISKTISYNSGFVGYPPYSNLAPWANMNLWVEVTSASLPNSVIALIENTCSALPVKLRSFDATLNGNGVELNWVTAGEMANLGFYVEKRVGDGNWMPIGFVRSLATKGTSENDLYYTYTDNIISKGIVQYRLKQVDLGGSYSFSEVRIIKTGEKRNISVFPNPTTGTVNIAFTDANTRYTISIYEATGKITGQWQNVNSLFTARSLAPGAYFIKIMEQQSKRIDTFKLIVQ